MKSKRIVCNKCDGSGILTKKCRKCNGTKLFKNKECPLCKGSGKYVFMKNKHRHETIKCDQCNGTGTNKLKSRSRNPVITPKLGASIKRKFKRVRI